MTRFLAIVAATAASAAVAAAITIPAGADQNGDPDAQFVSCLRSHGADIPAGTQGAAIKEWVGAHQNDDATMRALKACDVNSPAPQELVTCLRAQGLDVPATIDQLKAWIAQHADDASARPAFEACHFVARPGNAADHPDAKDFADCLRHNGVDVPANLDGGELKTWVRDHASQDALKACSGSGEGGPACGPGKPAPAETKPAPTPATTTGSESTTT
jgi:hypothetical protein